MMRRSLSGRRDLLREYPLRGAEDVWPAVEAFAPEVRQRGKRVPRGQDTRAGKWQQGYSCSKENGPADSEPPRVNAMPDTARSRSNRHPHLNACGYKRKINERDARCERSPPTLRSKMASAKSSARRKASRSVDCPM